MDYSDKKESLEQDNDWNIALQLLKDKEISIRHHKTTQNAFILPLDGANKLLQGVNANHLYKCLRQSGNSIIFRKKNTPKSKLLVIKFTGDEHYNETIISLATHPALASGATIIVSPNHMSKLNRKKESQFVSLVKHYTRETYFIKLPLNTLNDYLKYAQHEHASLLLLPFKDLLAYLSLLKITTHASQLIPAAFHPDLDYLNMISQPKDL